MNNQTGTADTRIRLLPHSKDDRSEVSCCTRSGHVPKLKVRLIS